MTYIATLYKFKTHSFSPTR